MSGRAVEPTLLGGRGAGIQEKRVCVRGARTRRCRGGTRVARARVLVVEDEINVGRLVALYLEREGFEVRIATDGEEALAAFREQRPDLVLLDLMLPKVDGWEVCKRLRRLTDVPVIMLTARGDEVDRLLGLELGADDYVTKPFSPRELVLRVKAVLRRAGKGDDPEVLRFPGLEIDGKKRQVRVNDREVALTRREFDLLWHLASHEGRAFDREQLLEQVWGYEYTGDVRTIDVHITRIREKIEDGSVPRYIHTVWGIGYKFQVSDGGA